MAYAQAHRTPLPAEGSSSRSSGPSFVVDQAKLNSKFEAYKLIQDDASPSFDVKSYSLPSRPPRLSDLYQSRKESKREGKLTFSGLGYKETKERALHQVLIPSKGTRRKDEPFAGYIDANGFVVALTYDASKDRVLGHPGYRLSQGQTLEDGHYGEASPSLASVSSTQWIASGGDGELALLKLEKNQVGESGIVRWTAGASTRWSISSNGAAVLGNIKACKKFGDKLRVLIQSTRTYTKQPARGKDSMQGLGFQRAEQQPSKPSANGQAHSQTSFKVHLFEIALDDVNESSDIDEEKSKPAALLWSVRGEEPLMQARLSEQECLLCAEAPFAASNGRIDQDSSSTEAAAGTEAPSAPCAEASTASGARGRRRAPHFSWAQTGDTVTIAFALPPWINKLHIRAHFSLSALSLSLTQEALALLGTSSSAKIAEIDDSTRSNTDGQDDDDMTNAARMIASGRYVSRPTWAEIDPTGSLWTVEKAKGISLLTLHLEKKHEGTRWMQVFADRTGTRPRGGKQELSKAGTNEKSSTQVSFQQAKSMFERVVAGNGNQEEDEEEEDAEDNEDDVPETMDPSELISMLEGMQKYTVDEESTDLGSDRTGFSSHNGTGQNGGTSLSLDQPSLLKDSLEEEDANVGHNLVLSTVTHSSGAGVQIHTPTERETTVLATSLPGPSQEEEGALAIKYDLDGAVFRPSTTSTGWEHVVTMPALAFVLASKRDAQRVHIHHRQTKDDQNEGYVALAFESAPQVTGSGSSGDNNAASGAGNLFLYYSPSSVDAKHAQSRVVRLGASDPDARAASNGLQEEAHASGALLGVCSALLPRGDSQEEGDKKRAMEEALVCLCENRLLLLRGVL